MYSRILKMEEETTLKVENFAGTKFRGFRGFRCQPRNLIPAKPLTLPIRAKFNSRKICPRWLSMKFNTHEDV